MLLKGNHSAPHGGLMKQKKSSKLTTQFVCYHNQLMFNCIWQLKIAINGSIFYECKKSQNTQVVHKNLHILGSLILFLIVLKHPLV